MSRAHYTPYSGPGPKRVYYVKHVGPGQDKHQLAYDEPISIDSATGHVITRQTVLVPGIHPTLEAAAVEAAALNLGLERCAKCKRLFEPSALESGKCCACSPAQATAPAEEQPTVDVPPKRQVKSRAGHNQGG